MAFQRLFMFAAMLLILCAYSLEEEDEDVLMKAAGDNKKKKKTRTKYPTPNTPPIDLSHCETFEDQSPCEEQSGCRWITTSFYIHPDYETLHSFSYGCQPSQFCKLTQGTVQEQIYQCNRQPNHSCTWNQATNQCVDRPRPPPYCQDSCYLCAKNGICEDGGPGSVPNGLCYPGSDCSDCGDDQRTSPKVLTEDEKNRGIQGNMCAA